MALGQMITNAASETASTVKPAKIYRQITLGSTTLTLVIVSVFLLVILITFLLYKTYNMVKAFSFCS